MKTIFLITMTTVMLLGIPAFAGAANTGDSGANSSAAPGTERSTGRPKVLVAYFSCTGNTEALARYAANALGADLYKITPQEPYSSADLNYRDDNSRSSLEMNNDSSRPAINGAVSNMQDYDIVFLGYPLWWGQAPRIINTFLESYDFSGKTIAPFCTSGSSAFGSSDRNLHGSVSKATWASGARVSGNNELISWVNGLGLPVTLK